MMDEHEKTACEIVPCRCQMYGYSGRGRSAPDCPQHEYADDIALALRSAAEAAAAKERESLAAWCETEARKVAMLRWMDATVKARTLREVVAFLRGSK